MCYLLCTCRGSHLPLRLHCGWSAGHGHLCCRKIPERVFQGCGRYQCWFELSILLGEADRREPADRTLQTEVKSREKLGQVSSNGVTSCCHLEQCFRCLSLYPKSLARCVGAPGKAEVSSLLQGAESLCGRHFNPWQPVLSALLSGSEQVQTDPWAAGEQPRGAHWGVHAPLWLAGSKNSCKRIYVQLKFSWNVWGGSCWFCWWQQYFKDKEALDQYCEMD